jgi:hypothetical protein
MPFAPRRVRFPGEAEILPSVEVAKYRIDTNESNDEENDALAVHQRL